MKKLLPTSLIMRSELFKSLKSIIFGFQSHEQYVSRKCDREIKGIQIYKVAPVANF
jgi:hypothetical protein